MKKVLIIMLCALTVFAFAACGSSEPEADSEDYAVSGNTIEYMGATLAVNGAEFVHDDNWGEDYLCLHTIYTNNAEESYELASAFVIVADQGNGDIDAREASDYDTAEETNAHTDLEVGATADCDLYFPVDASAPVTIRIMNPDGMDTVFAEFAYTPE